MSLRAAFALAFMAAAWPAAAFEQRVADPGFTVVVPQLPQSVRADVSAVPAGRDVITRVCAGQFIRTLVRRPGMPDRDSIYRAPLDADNFLVLYRLGDEGARTLHAHLLAAARGTHCVEAHFERPLAPGEDEDDWRRSFTGARIVSDGPAR